jgi:hypothetical protein
LRRFLCMGAWGFVFVSGRLSNPTARRARCGGWIPRTRSGFITLAERAQLEVEDCLPDYKPDEEDKEEEELEKEEAESDADEPGEYEPLSVGEKKSSSKPKKGRRKKSKSVR